MKQSIFFVHFVLVSLTSLSQEQRYPVFVECLGTPLEETSRCFYKQTQKIFYREFKEPLVLKNQNFKESVNVVFLVTNEGLFKFIYLDSSSEALSVEVARVFEKFPKITPALYNKHPVEMRFILPLHFPLSDKNPHEITLDVTVQKKEDNALTVRPTSSDPLHTSSLNIPFTHQRYVAYEYAIHRAGGHTASKPYLYKDVNKHLKLDIISNDFLSQKRQTWLGKKIWNQPLLLVQEKEYWFKLNFLADIQSGTDYSEKNSFTYTNSRIAQINGGLGSRFSFSATVYESQGRFAAYVNERISDRSENNRPAFSEGLVTGRGKAKGFRNNAFDYPVAEGYLSFTANKFLQLQFGHGKNFIGDGYRSFLLSDVAAPSLNLKASVDFWKFKYTNLWIWGNDLRRDAVINYEHARKYIAIHYLSINLSEKFNLGLFDAAVTSGEMGLDAAFLNPVIFYRSVEFNRGEDSGNALLGFTTKYRLSNAVSLYSQVLIDELSTGSLTNPGDWKNKFAFQLGAKYFNAFKVNNLFLQGEFNRAKPYTFSHKNPLLNFGNNNQPLAHLWGANFWEVLGIVRYKKARWSGIAKVILGKKGFDFIDETISYGGNIFQSYALRQGDMGNSITQGNTASIFNIGFQGDYLINPSNQLSVFAGLSYRNFSIEATTNGFSTNNSLWIRAGIRANLFNWYFDF